MLLKSLTKYPLLMVGFLFLAIFLFQLRDQGYFKNRADKLIPTSCKAVRARLDKYLHKTWKLKCQKNNLEVVIPVPKKTFANISTSSPVKMKEELRSGMYRLLANSYISISKYSPPDSLERTDIISISLRHPQIHVNSVSEGKHVVNLKSMKSFDKIKEHLQRTIQIQEVFQ